jgi:hypothetical protein
MDLLFLHAPVIFPEIILNPFHKNIDGEELHVLVNFRKYLFHFHGLV